MLSAVAATLLVSVATGHHVAPVRLSPNLSWRTGEAAASQAESPKGQTEPKATKAEKAAAKGATAAPGEPTGADQGTGGPEEGVRARWRQHPSIRFGSALRLDFQAKVQEDGHRSYAGAPLDPWELHRTRVGVQGRLFKDIEFEIERELTEKELSDSDIVTGALPSSPWKDVYLNLAHVKDAQIQIGKFKIPFGLDQLTGVTHNDFVYRSLGANYLAPARDVGIVAHGRFFARGLSYRAGIFRHDGDNARSKNIQGGDETVAARVTGAPLRRLGMGNLELGTAFTISRLSDDSFEPNGLRARTLVTQDTFYEPVYVKGLRRRWEVDADWAAGPASARSEFTWVTDDRLQQGLADDTLPDARARAWYVSGTWLITGERKERPLEPSREFLQGGVGAVEVVGRWERLWYDSSGGGRLEEASRSPRSETILPAGERALTVGVNWMLNRWMKVQINAIREHVEDAERSPVSNGAAFWSRVVRFQLVL